MRRKVLIRDLSLKKIYGFKIILRSIVLNDVSFLNKFGFVLGDEAVMKKKLFVEKQETFKRFVKITLKIPTN